MKPFRSAAVAATCLVAGTSAHAASVQFDGADPAVTISNAISLDRKKVSAQVGLMNWTGVGADNAGITYQTFCIELTEYIRVDDIVSFDEVAPGTLFSDAQVDLLERFWASRFDTTRFKDDPKEAAAFQLGIWEIIYDYDGSSEFGFGNGGRFSVDLPTQDGTPWHTALTWLSEVETSEGGPRTSLVAWTAEDFQDQITVSPISTPTPTAAMSGLTGLAMILLRRRRMA